MLVAHNKIENTKNKKDRHTTTAMAKMIILTTKQDEQKPATMPEVETCRAVTSLFGMKRVR